MVRGPYPPGSWRLFWYFSHFAFGWLAFLVVERIRLDRHRDAIPLRIAVTGTRGKTAVTRRLAAVLTEDGRRVLAKTTGSEAAYLLPDGTVQEIHRLGAPSIIEQKRLLGRGAKLGVDVVVAEVMSVHPENHQVEIHGILRPHLVLVTNFRVDHVEAHGKTREEVASVLAPGCPPGASGPGSGTGSWRKPSGTGRPRAAKGRSSGRVAGWRRAGLPAGASGNSVRTWIWSGPPPGPSGCRRR